MSDVSKTSSSQHFGEDEETESIVTEDTEEYDSVAPEGTEDEIIFEGDELSGFYDPEEYISKPFITETCSLSEDALKFHYSFGYDCQQYYNLCVADEEHILFISGNLIHIFNVETKELQFRRSARGGGIGHIVKNPKFPHIAIGEKGNNPLIIIYHWPSFNIITVLRNGTKYEYAHLSYSPDGELLCSQGGNPDLLLTIWNWSKSSILLRTKAHGQDVINAEFSRHVPGHLASSGLGHIKFWKMAHTFTGLKLQGELGRFGKTEVSDIVGIYSMPDEKVLSGSEWGNILVWALGSIKVEVSQRGRKNCHSAEISQIIYNSVTNEVITIGMDGWIKIWTYSVIDLADPAEDDPFVEMQPLFEVEVKNELQNAKLRSIVKRNNDYEDFIWFAQDYNGGLWKIDLNLTQQVEPPEQLLACHSGVVVDIASSPADYLLASLGTDGWIFIHNVPEKKTVVTKLFKPSGTSLIWLPQHVESSGTVLIGGFSDGRIRMFAVSFSKTKHRSTGSTDECIRIIQISKPHTSSVTKISLNPRGSILVTGSDDCTIFVYQINPKKEFVSLEPIGFVSTPGAVRNITWKRDQMCDALISCSNGYLLEARLPEHKVQYTKTSYKLKVNKHILQFRSIRSEIERELLLKEIEFKKNEKLNRKKAELEKVRAENPGLDIDEEMFLVDSEEEEELPPLYYPEEPNAVLFAKYTSYNSIWLSVDGYDAGYIYEYKFGSENPVKSIFIPESNNVPIHCYSELENCKYLILGFSNGKIRIVEVDNERDCDFSRFWELPMHDNFNGNINQLCFSYDYKFLYSCGNDGNIFTYEVNIPSSAPIKKRKLVLTSLQLKDMADAEDDDEWSLEEIKKNEESENKMKLANARKRKVQKKLEKLKENYDALISRNEKLPPSQVIPQTEFELDTRITEFIQKHIDDEFNLMKRKLAFELAKSKLQLKKLQNYFLENISTFETKVTGIRKSISVSSFSHRKLGEELLQAETETEIFIKNAMLEKDIIDKSLVQRRKGSGVTICSKTDSFENYLLQISSIYNKLDIRVKRAIRKQGIWRQNKLNRLNQWREFMDLKPDINVTDSEDIKAIETAIKEIGDFKLKTDEDYRVPDNLRVSTAQKYLDLLKAQHEVFQMKDNFNKQLLEMQDRKVALTKTIKQLHFDLNLLHQELTEEQIKMPPPVPEIRISTGFSQLKFELNSADPGFYVPVPCMYDNEYSVLNLDVATLSSHAFSHQSESIACEDIHALEKLSANDTIETPWEKEMMCFRLTRKLFEQDEMLKNISQSITEFDNDLQALHSKKLQLAVEIKFLEIFVLTLSEELIIIRSYSSVENGISDKITRCKAEKNDKMQEVNAIQIKIETKMQEVAQMQEKQLEIQQSFTDMVADNKFTTYLTRLFKKKKKVYTKESDSESSSTDDASIGDMYEDDEDSPDFIPINLGESICPPGCDHEVFTKTLALRKDRYDLDDAVTEAKKVIEILQKEHESHTKLIKNIDTILQNFVNELTIVEREKQKKLNNVDTVVLLRLSQLQNMEGPNKFETLGNTLIFRKQMLYTLNCRVAELADETENEKTKRKKYRKYLCNLDRGCRIMKERFKFLKKEVKKKIVEKFGRELDVEVMEQTVLRRMINDARSIFSLKKVRSLMDERVSQLKETLLVKLEESSLVQRNNTKKIQLQTMLEEEITNIHTLLMYESVNKEKFTTDIKFKQYQDEIQKLNNVICNQLEEKKFLEHEIKLLKYKTLPTLRVDQMYVPYDKIVPVPAITVSDKSSKKESEEVIKSPFNICEEVIEYILEQVTINTVRELSRYDSDELKTVKSVELIVKELLNDIIISVEHSDLEEIKSSLQVTKTLLDELVKSSVPECMTSGELIALDVIQNVIDNLSDYDNEVGDYLEITEEETNFDLIEVTSSLEFPNTLEVCVNIIEDIINNLPM